MEPRLAVGGVVLAEGERVLLVKRGQAPLAGTWSLPGGKVEPGESLEAAVVREVLEETGVRVDAGEVVAVVTIESEGFAYEIHELLCTVAPGVQAELRAGDDASAVAWVRFDELGALGVTEAVEDVVRRARAHVSCAPAGGLRRSPHDPV
jgi:8-oxo-dGTP diphosphatase